MTVFGVVITVLLVTPWMLVLVPVVGAAWSAATRRLEKPGIEPARMPTRSATDLTGRRADERSRSARGTDESSGGPRHDLARCTA